MLATDVCFVICCVDFAGHSHVLCNVSINNFNFFEIMSVNTFCVDGLFRINKGLSIGYDCLLAHFKFLKIRFAMINQNESNDFAFLSAIYSRFAFLIISLPYFLWRLHPYFIDHLHSHY